MVKVVEMTASILNGPTNQNLLETIERAGRVCYKSEGKIGDGTCKTFIKSIITRGHESVLEHCSISALFTVDRGVTHEIVRHRIASYSQESTRYCNYGNEQFDGGITVCRPTFWHRKLNAEMFNVWYEAVSAANDYYLKLLALGAKPQEARSVLPQSTKADIVVTMNVREWRHFFKLRCSPAAHPDIRKAATELLEEMASRYEVVFDDLYEQFCCSHDDREP